MSRSPRTLQLALVAAGVVLLCWGLLRVRPRVVALREAWAATQQLATQPQATPDEVLALEGELALERDRGAAQAPALSATELSRLAAEAGLAVDVSELWTAPAAGSRPASMAGPALAERLHMQEPARPIIRWSARGDYAGLQRFLESLARAGHAAVLELGLRTPAGGVGPLQIDLVLTP